MTIFTTFEYKNGRLEYYGAFKTQKHILEYFKITRAELKKYLVPNKYLRFGSKSIKIKTENIY